MNPRLYAKAKAKADETYKTHSAYKSGFIVKEYKRLGGKYLEDSKPKDLKRWFKEKWGDVGIKNILFIVLASSIEKTPLSWW
jgi:hypothetical protein